ncbi:MAG: 2-dehydropantoate 2-reductase [Proteobacteria bacterium]|nr:2-dehydropantoate 2-reductase [Pseudomonadota bacterium]
MTIVILGGGAIGRLLGVYLSKGGHNATLVDPNLEVIEAINSRGIGFMEEEATNPDAISYIPARAVQHTGQVKHCDLVILAVKSFDTLTAVQAAAHLLRGNTPIITLQTGLGNIELMERVIDEKQIIGGFTFMAATALGPGVVRQGGAGKTYLGELDGQISERLQTVTDLFNQCGLTCKPVRRVVGRLWCKVIVYSAINAVSSIPRVKNGQLLDSMESITLIKRLIDEGRKVAEAKAIDLVYHDLYELFFAACRRSSENLSSMLQDILNGKRTEIDAQCGALAAFGEQAGIPTPTQQTMVELIKLLEKKSAGPTA